MNDKYSIGNAILWAAAIVASAILHAPTALCAILLPGLAICSLVIIGRRDADQLCETSR